MYFDDRSGPHGAEEEFWTNVTPCDSTLLPQRQDPYGLPEFGGLNGTPDECCPHVPDELADPDFHASETDPLGSWTGVPDPDTNEIPTQDADDL